MKSKRDHTEAMAAEAQDHIPSFDNMKGENEDSESPWKGPSSVKDQKARRWMSSTAASLLDNNEEEEEEGLEEPELLSISVEESSSDCSLKVPPEENAGGSNTIDTERGTAALSMIRLTEGMTDILCPTSLEGAEAVVAVNLKTHHRRIRSETDVLQKNLASSCGSGAFCMSPKEAGFTRETSEKHLIDSLSMIERLDTLKISPEETLDDDPSTLERTDTLKKNDMPHCTDFNLLDLREVVAFDIMAILGSSTGVAAEWFKTLGSWLTPTSRESHHLPRRVFRNRCSVRTAQEHRLKELWYKWHSDGSDDSSSKLGPLQSKNPNMPPFRVWSVAVTKSLDDAELLAPVITVSVVPGSQSFNLEDTVPVKQVQFFTSGTSRQPRVASPADLYYDSDPEIFRVARHLPSAALNKDDYMKKPLRHRRRISIPTPIDTSVSKDDYIKNPLRHGRQISIPSPIDTSISVGSKDVGVPLTPKHVKNKAAHSFDAVSTFDSAEDKFDFHDDALVKDFIKELTTDKVNLIWHPSPDVNEIGTNPPSPSSSKSPVSVKGWFEMGSRLYNRVIQPKFMWRETYQPDLLNHKRLGLSGRSPNSLDLLNMIRILKPTSLDRSAYPFAKIDRTFTILSHTNDQYVFEAASAEERDWLVHGLKLVVARLASMIIVGDDHMFVEFFSPWASSPVTSDSTTEEGQVLSYATEEQPGGRPLFVSTTEKDREQLWGGWS